MNSLLSFVRASLLAAASLSATAIVTATTLATGPATQVGHVAFADAVKVSEAIRQLSLGWKGNLTATDGSAELHLAAAMPSSVLAAPILHTGAVAFTAAQPPLVLERGAAFIAA